ncbi:MAG: hypothetical protein R3D26_07750 [Cyanobacteriota/Melainabacteria group bacterium]
MRKLTRAGIFLHSLPFAGQFVFICDDTFESHGSTGVEFAGGDADLGAESIAESVGKTGGDIVIDACRVDPSEELLEGFCIGTDQTVGMTRAMAIDMVYRLVQR